MKAKVLGIAVIVVALGVLVNALALTSVTVDQNKINIPIVSTDSALISVSAGADGDVSFNAAGNGGKAQMSVATGLQPASTYEFDTAFVITNHSANAVKITVPSTVTAGSGITSISLYKTGTTTPITGEVLAASTGSVGVKMVIAVDPTATVSTAPNFTFSITGAK